MGHCYTMVCSADNYIRCSYMHLYYSLRLFSKPWHICKNSEVGDEFIKFFVSVTGSYSLFILFLVLSSECPVILNNVAYPIVKSISPDIRINVDWIAGFKNHLIFQFQFRLGFFNIFAFDNVNHWFFHGCSIYTKGNPSIKMEHNLPWKPPNW